VDQALIKIDITHAGGPAIKKNQVLHFQVTMAIIPIAQKTKVNSESHNAVEGFALDILPTSLIKGGQWPRRGARKASKTDGNVKNGQFIILACPGQLGESFSKNIHDLIRLKGAPIPVKQQFMGKPWWKRSHIRISKNA